MALAVAQRKLTIIIYLTAPASKLTGMGSICLAAEHSICLPVCRVNEGILVPDLPNIIIMMYSSGNTDKSGESVFKKLMLSIV